MSESNQSFTSHGTGLGRQHSRVARGSGTGDVNGNANKAAAAAVAAVRAEGSIHPGGNDFATAAAGAGGARPGSPLAQVLVHPVFVEGAGATADAWPELPPAVAAVVPCSLLEPGAAVAVVYLATVPIPYGAIHFMALLML